MRSFIVFMVSENQKEKGWECALKGVRNEIAWFHTPESAIRALSAVTPTAPCEAQVVDLAARKIVKRYIYQDKWTLKPESN